MRMKHLLLAAAAAFLVNACENCYNDRFGAEMMGKHPSTICSLLGTPTSIGQAGGIEEYVWYADKSYDTTHTTPGHSETWYDKKGVRHETWEPATVTSEHVVRYSRLSIRFSGNRAVSYSFDDEGGMCNYWVPQSYINRYKQEDKMKKNAVSERHFSSAPTR